ncbi:hypothetical protein [Streptomyces botrytidirepellens]|uniref:hypothetical protein n=1 Tax=Streptomyces botrytidirepellens TaxID=2486417 RepID=UPI0011CE186F|nr:hypothetical protein [Streptomyces botrytidirepellens]
MTAPRSGERGVRNIHGYPRTFNTLSAPGAFRSVTNRHFLPGPDGPSPEVSGPRILSLRTGPRAEQGAP